MDLMDDTYFTKKGCLLFFVLLVVGILSILNSMFTPFVRPPEMGRDLPHSWRDANREFHARVEQKFKVGMPVEDLVSELERQGFKISTFAENTGISVFAFRSIVHRAHYNKFVVPCASDWFVDWQEENAVVTIIDGGFSGACL